MSTFLLSTNGLFAATFQCPTLVQVFFCVQCIWTGVMGTLITYEPALSPINDTGTFVRKGSLVSYDAYTMGRNEELWEAPLEFRPERFLKPDAGGAGGVAVVTPDLFKFTAFQAGPRRCLGMDLALLEAKAAIGAVLRRFELCLPAGAEGAAAEPPAYRYALTLPVLDGMCLEVRPLSD